MPMIDVYAAADLFPVGSDRELGEALTRAVLRAEGVERALHDGAKAAFDAEAGGALDRKALLFALIDWYLGIGHRDGLATSCAVASLAADVSRGGARVRSAYTDQLAAYLDLFVRLMGGHESSKAKRLKAVAAWATMVGAVSMARAVSDDKLSREILKTAADGVKDQLA